MSSEALILRLAREVAMDIRPMEDVLRAHAVTDNEWQRIQKSARFQAYLVEAASQWESALNTADRVKIKAVALLEEWLVELDSRLHDPRENLTAKIEGGKLLARLSGLGERDMTPVGGVGERFKLVINIGKDYSKTIDATPTLIEEVVNG